MPEEPRIMRQTAHQHVHITDRAEGTADDTRRWLSQTEFSLLLHVAEQEAVASLDVSLDSS